MATLSTMNPTLADLASRLDKDDKIATIIELLKLNNPILDDMVMLAANDGTNHKTTIRSGLPSATWRQLYQGVQPSKSTTVQVKDACGMLETYSEVDAALIKLAKDPAGFRASEDVAFVQAMNHEMASAVFYGNTKTDPERPMGLGPRYNSLSAENAANIVNGGGTGSDNTSIWLVTWGGLTCHGIYPETMPAGLETQDLGEETKTQSDGLLRVMRTHYKWTMGLTLRDWQAVGRICNIDVSELADAGATGYDGADLPNMMIKLYNKVQKRFALGRPVFYCNETVKTALDLIASNRRNTWFTVSDGIDGMPITRFRGIPIKVCDAILDTEEAVA